MAGVVLFTASSLLCGLAWNIETLDVARALQGIGGAALFATALALIGHEYRGPDRFGALAVWGATVGAAVASGPLIGGILTDGLGWRWIFFVNIPVGVFAFAVALTRISESRDEGARHTDVRGLVTFSAALFLIVFGILRGNARGWTSALILLSLVGGVLLLVLFVVIELRQERPMLDVTLFRQPRSSGSLSRRSASRPGCSRCSRTCRSIFRTSSATHRLRPAFASCRSQGSSSSCRS